MAAPLPDVVTTEATTAPDVTTTAAAPSPVRSSGVATTTLLPDVATTDYVSLIDVHTTAATSSPDISTMAASSSSPVNTTTNTYSQGVSMAVPPVSSDAGCQKRLMPLPVVKDTTSLQWSSEVHGNDVIYACANNSVVFPWHVSKSDSESILNIQWFYEGRSQELIASEVHGQFVTSPVFSGRVERTANAEIVLHHVTLLDKGNYSVEVVVRDAAGGVNVLRRSVLVEVSDHLMTTDGLLHVTVADDAVFDQSRDQWCVELRCGNFTFRAPPPYQVEWVTPSGTVLPSTSFTGDHFSLLLPTPAEGGSYTCRVPANSTACACLPSNGQRQANAMVDSLKARLTVLEAQQKTLTEENAKLQADNERLKETDAQLQETDRNFTALYHAVNSQVLQAEALLLLAEQKFVSFMARPSSVKNYNAGNVVNFDHVITNNGGAYHPDTGIFTAPVTGSYVFYITIVATDNGGDARERYVSLVKDSASVEEVWSGIDNDHYVPGSGQAVLSLTVGQSVWVRNGRDHTQFYWPATSFSGALLQAKFPPTH